MNGARVLVTGAGGMIGANFCRRMSTQACTIYALVRCDGVPPRLVGLEERLTLLRGDLTDADSVTDAVKAAAPDVVFHLASTPFNPPPTVALHLQVNVSGTANLLAALTQIRPSARVIYTGSAAQYGDGDGLRETDPDRPATLLGASKSCAAVLLHAYGRLHGLSTTELRLFTPFGPWERPGRLVPSVILSALRGQAVELNGGDQQRDFLYIDDVTDALLRAAATDLPPQTTLNICSGAGTSVQEMATRILHQMGDPVPLIVNAGSSRADEILRMSGDNTQARALLGWSPQMTLDDGIARMIDWVSAAPDLAAGLT